MHSASPWPHRLLARFYVAGRARALAAFPPTWHTQRRASPPPPLDMESAELARNVAHLRLCASLLLAAAAAFVVARRTIIWRLAYASLVAFALLALHCVELNPGPAHSDDDLVSASSGSPSDDDALLVERMPEEQLHALPAAERRAVMRAIRQHRYSQQDAGSSDSSEPSVSSSSGPSASSSSTPRSPVITRARRTARVTVGAEHASRPLAAPLATLSSGDGFDGALPEAVHSELVVGAVTAAAAELVTAAAADPAAVADLPVAAPPAAAPAAAAVPAAAAPAVTIMAPLPRAPVVAVVAAAPPTVARRAAAQNAPVQRPVPQPTDAFLEWLGRQSTLNTATWLDVVEFVEEKRGAVWQPARERRVAVHLCGAIRHNKTQDAIVKRAACELAATLPADVRAATGRRHKIQVTQFQSCSAIDLASRERVEYGVFPLLPSMTSADGTFRARYVSLRVMTPEEIEALPKPVEAPVLGAAPQHAHGATSLWDQPIDAADHAVVELVLAKFGEAIPLELRMPDGVQREAFRQLCARTLRGYRCADAALRDKMLRRLIALMRMHMRRLQGSASSRVREKFAMTQLSGSVCTQRVVVERQRPAGPQQQPDPAAAEKQHTDRCVRTAFKLALLGFVSRAAAALVRLMPVKIDEEQKIADLAKLHPPGSPPVDVSTPAERVFSLANVKLEDIRASVRSCLGGSAAGVDGWTFEALHDALEHYGFAHEFVAVVVDICNGDVAPDTARLLAASWLVGIPKGATAADGTRPIALGSVLLKVAAARALAVASTQLQLRFRGSQFGCATKGGGEFIVHSVREFLRSGKRPNGSASGSSRVVVTLDFANAFNTPSRQAMWDATRDIPALHGVFKVSYAQHSPLYIVGTDATLTSECGARQGTVDGPVTFALTLQALLNAANADAAVQLLAYLDDVTILADSPQAAERCVVDFQRRAAALGMLLKPTKCEAMSFDPETSLDGCAMLQQFKRARVVKLLGASIGLCDSDEEEHLFGRMNVVAQLFMQRVQLGASPQFFALLQMCGVPKMSYAIRVHASGVTRRVCQLHDARVEEVIAHWASVSIDSERQRMILSLPRTLGGMGLYRTELLAPAAYHASKSAAAQNRPHATSQAALAQIIYRDLFDRFCAPDGDLRRHLQIHALEGAAAGLSSLSVRVHPDVFGCSLRTWLMTDARTVAPGTRTLPCQGCGKSFAVGGAWGQHVSSCAAFRGGHVTKRHDSVVGMLRRMLLAAGFSVDPGEPRDLSTFTCRCGLENLSDAQFEEHRQTCARGKEPGRRSGPDILYEEGGKAIAADVTIRNLLTASHSEQSADEAFADARQQKQLKYAGMCARRGAQLVTLAATASGHLAPELAKLLRRVASLSFRDRRTVMNEVSAGIIFGSAAARLSAETASGLRPASIALTQVRLLEAFRFEPLPQAATTALSLPPVLPDPAPAPTLEERQAAGVVRALRDALPELAVQWADLMRAAEQQAAAQRRAERDEQRPADAEPDAPPEAPAPNDDPELQMLRDEVATRAQHEAAEHFLMQQQAEAEAAAKQQREALQASQAASVRALAEVTRHLEATAAISARTAAVVEARAEHLELVTNVAVAQASADIRVHEQLAADAARAHAANVEELARVRRSAAQSVARCEAAIAQLAASESRTAQQRAEILAERARSENRAREVQQVVATDAVSLAEAVEAAQLQARQAESTMHWARSQIRRVDEDFAREASVFIDNAAGATCLRPPHGGWYADYSGVSPAAPQYAAASPARPALSRARSLAPDALGRAHSTGPQTELRRPAAATPAQQVARRNPVAPPHRPSSAAASASSSPPPSSPSPPEPARPHTKHHDATTHQPHTPHNNVTQQHDAPARPREPQVHNLAAHLGPTPPANVVAHQENIARNTTEDWLSKNPSLAVQVAHTPSTFSTTHASSGAHAPRANRLVLDLPPIQHTAPRAHTQHHEQSHTVDSLPKTPSQAVNTNASPAPAASTPAPSALASIVAHLMGGPSQRPASTR